MKEKWPMCVPSWMGLGLCFLSCFSLLSAEDLWDGSNVYKSAKHPNYDPITARGTRKTDVYFRGIIPMKQLALERYNPARDGDEWVMKTQALHRITEDKRAIPKSLMSRIHTGYGWGYMHSDLRNLAAKNERNWQFLTDKDILLYHDKLRQVYLIASYELFDTMFLVRTNLFLFNVEANKESLLPTFKYVPSKPVNPKTRKPWMGLESDYAQDLLKSSAGALSPEETTFLKDLLSILNENFHYYIGEPFVDLKDIGDAKYQLCATYLPYKVLCFNNFDLFLPTESDSKRALSSYLGRAAYDFSKVWDWEATAWQQEITGDNSYDVLKLCENLKLVDGQDVGPLWYHSATEPRDIKATRMGRWAQVYNNPLYMYQMSTGLTRLMLDKGVDVDSEAGNESVFHKLLYHINLKMQNYLNAYCASDYICVSAMEGTNSQPDNFEGYSSMAQLVKLPSDADLVAVKDLDITSNATLYAWVGDALGVSQSKGPTASGAAGQSAAAVARQAYLSEQLLANAKSTNVDLIKSFIEQGADVNACDENRNTALHLAAMVMNTPVTMLLLESGADTNKANKEGRLPLESWPNKKRAKFERYAQEVKERKN